MAEERMSPEARKQQMLAEAIRQAEAKGIRKVSRVSVASKLKVSSGLVTRYFGSVGGLREAVKSAMGA